VDNANRAIFNAANTNPRYAGMGTTLVLATFREGQLLLGHVGDSRAYRLRSGQLTQITRDHSLLQEQLDAGLLTPEEAVFSSNKNLVTRAVGVEDAVMLELHQHEVQPGDLYMLCSDGLSDMLDSESIQQLLLSYPSLSEAAQALIDAANDMGGKDNIAIVLARAEGRTRQGGRAWWPFGRKQTKPRPWCWRCKPRLNGRNNRLRSKHGQAGGFARRRGDQGGPDHQGQDHARAPAVQRHRDRQSGGQR
jgi:protein phosphatase